jgi:ABC-2 type transport system ATP-binding protein
MAKEKNKIGQHKIESAEAILIEDPYRVDIIVFKLLLYAAMRESGCAIAEWNLLQQMGVLTNSLTYLHEICFDDRDIHFENNIFFSTNSRESDSNELNLIIEKTSIALLKLEQTFKKESPVILVIHSEATHSFAFTLAETTGFGLISIPKGASANENLDALLVHELVHCFFRSGNRFLDEGIATRMQYEIADHVDYPFSIQKREQLIFNQQVKLFPLKKLLNTSSVGNLSFENITEDEDRSKHIYLEADCFIGYIIEHSGFEGLASLFDTIRLSRYSRSISEIVESFLNCTIDKLEIAIFGSKSVAADISAIEHSIAEDFEQIENDIRKGRSSRNPADYLHHAKALRQYIDEGNSTIKSRLLLASILLLSTLHGKINPDINSDNENFAAASFLIDDLHMEIPSDPLVLKLCGEREVIKVLNSKRRMQQAIHSTKAKMYFNKAHKLDPTEPEVLIDLAHLSFNTPEEFGGNRKQAISYLEKAAENPLYKKEAEYVISLYSEDNPPAATDNPNSIRHQPRTHCDSTAAMIDINAIRFDRPGFSLDIGNVKMHEGEIVSIVGPNGVGKSTLVEIMLGLRTAGKVDIKVCGVPCDIWMKNNQNKKSLGCLLQFNEFPSMIKVQEVINLHKVLYKKASSSIYKTLNIAELLDKKYSNISRGQKQRVDLYFALSHRPKIAFLDEPTTGLDANYCNVLNNIFNEFKKEKKHLIVQISQKSEELRVTDWVLWLKGGKLVAFETPTRLIKINLGHFCGQARTKNSKDFERLRHQFENIDGIKMLETKAENKALIYGSDGFEELFLAKIKSFKLKSYSISETTSDDLLFYIASQKD